MNHQIIKDEPISDIAQTYGRSNFKFPEFLELDVAEDGTKGDCLVYPDTPHNRKALVMAKCNYNRRNTKPLKGKHWIHRYEVRHGEPVIIIQRVV